MIKPRSNSDEDLVACAIDCLALWRNRGTRRSFATDEAEADMTASLAAIRPKLVLLAMLNSRHPESCLFRVPDGLLAKVDAAIGLDLEDQWAAPAVEPADRFRKPPWWPEEA
jgi:hypothetical protein